jgi:hypothetical protein
MGYRNHLFYKTIIALIAFSLLFEIEGLCETKTWTGFGGDASWSNPLNWSGSGLPQPTDDVLLDNTDLPVSYQVILPDLALRLKTIHIVPSPGRNIELILPASNILPDAVTVTGPGYGIELNAGAIFRNASGIASGESLSIADSLMIHDGGRYIHQTRASHANSILRILSAAPGTEQGVFDFDVPKASYTISVSNRIYGSLELHASAYGAPVNYTCSGANPLLLHGNMRIGENVNVSMNLSGNNGNILIEGDFIQEGGQFNLASGANDQTNLRIKGDLYQSSVATITETNNGNPWLELNGDRLQQIAMAGHILNQVGFRMNNKAGSSLRLPLEVSWELELDQGAIFSSAAAMLTLSPNCIILVDSTMLSGSYIDGPIRKLGLNDQEHFLFPVGSDGNLRWLELKNITGDFIVEYVRRDPADIGNALGSGLDHISKIEYWTVLGQGAQNADSKIELSFASSASGGVTDLNYLNVAKFQSGYWEDGGHTGVTGNFIQGSVVSGNADFLATQYTLASTVNLSNPLPLTKIDLEIKEVENNTVFAWTFEGPEVADHYDLYEESGGRSQVIAELKAINLQTHYTWTGQKAMKKGDHYFRVCMVDSHGKEYPGKLVLFKKAGTEPFMSWISTGGESASGKLLIESDADDSWNYEFISIRGYSICKGRLILKEGRNFLAPDTKNLSSGVYIFHAIDSFGNSHLLVFKKD